MKIKKIISSVIISCMVLISGIAAYAEDILVVPTSPQYEEICGYLTVNANCQADTYIKIYKITPETPGTEQLVYDTVIEANSGQASNNYIFELEHNSYNTLTNSYESCYDIYVSVNKYPASNKEENLIESKTSLIVRDSNYDINYMGQQSFFKFNINTTSEDLSEPVFAENGEELNKTYNLTFSCIQYIKGDANSDSKVNVRDCAYIANLLAQGKASELTMAADYNEDGKTNVRDAAAIANYLASGIDSPSEENTDPTEAVTDSSEANTEVTENTETTQSTSSSEENTEPVETETISTESTDPTEATTDIAEQSTDISTEN